MGGDSFPDDVVELIGYLGGARPGASVAAHPGEGTHVPVWILGSSLYGAQLAANVFAADTDAEGARLATSMQQAFARLRTGMPGKLPAPVDDIEAAIGADMTRAVNHALRVSAVG